MTIKILIVDDEPAIGKLLMYQLRTIGYQALYIADGLSALERIEREKPELVLLDVMMPMISGWEVCRQIRATSSVPVIMLTAKSSDADIVTGLSAGADDYIAKPFNMGQLQARIEAVLRRTRSSSRPRIAVPQTAEPAPFSTGPTRLVTPEPLPVTVPEIISDELIGVEPIPALPEELPTRLGPRLREARVVKGITLVQAARDCNTRWEFLQAIEQENYAYVPRPQLRMALQRYGRYLHIDVQPYTPQAQTAAQRFSALHYATIFTLVLLVIAVSIYLI
ncbi:MAG: response regulator [Roseiflexaceae bacterium]|nr:response regulator [Roseiflexaceae bacterium]